VTLNEARAAIYAQFQTAWASRTTLTFDGENFTEPEAESTSWVRLSVLAGGGGQLTLGAPGGRKYRRSGVATVVVYTGTKLGRKPGDVLAYAANAILEGESFSGIDCLDGTVIEGSTEKWLTWQVRVNFDYEETK
jgi:hypothetical protein